MKTGKIISPSTTKYLYFTDSRDPLTIGNDKLGRIYIDFSGTIAEVQASVSTAPTGADLICDLNYDGTTIWSTQANRITITAGANTGTQTTFNTTTVVAGHYFTFDIDQVGSTVAGSKIAIRMKVVLT